MDMGVQCRFTSYVPNQQMMNKDEPGEKGSRSHNYRKSTEDSEERRRCHIQRKSTEDPEEMRRCHNRGKSTDEPGEPDIRRIS